MFIEWIPYLVAALFLICGALCMVAVALGLPGTWILLGLAIVIEWLDRFYLPLDDRQTFGWWLLFLCLVLALLGELLEFIAGAIGAKKAGSSRRGTAGALVGGLLGAVAGIWIPVPIVGSLIGSFLGTFAGAILGELSQLEAHAAKRQTLKPALGATLGKILGTLAKVPIAITVWIALAAAAFWP